MSINDNLLDEFDELFSEESDKTATVNLDSSSDRRWLKCLKPPARS
jgi:hypothetical protein